VEAQKALAGAEKTLNDHSDAVKAKINAFHREQGDIDRRLIMLTQSETSDEAVRIFESSMEKLRRLDIATGFVGLLKDIELLR
jgi:RAD50-interacting protein 1